MSQNHKAPNIRLIPIDWIDTVANHAPFNDPPPFTPGEFVLANSIFSALMSGMNGLAHEIKEHFEAFAQGKMSGTEYAAKIAEAGSQKAAFGGAKAVVAFSAQEIVKALVDKWGQEFFKRFARSNVMTMLAFGAVDQGVDTYKYQTGQLELRDYKVNSAQNAGSASGAVTGGAAGALLGSVVPGIGTFWGPQSVDTLEVMAELC